MVLQKMCVSQNLSQIPGVSSSRIFMGGLLGVSLSFSMLRKSRAHRKCISLAVSHLPFDTPIVVDALLLINPEITRT